LGGSGVASTIWKYVIAGKVNRKPKNPNVLQRFYSETRFFIPAAKTIFPKQKQKNGTTPSCTLREYGAKNAKK
jgi:hypothetical protein